MTNLNLPLKIRSAELSSGFSSEQYMLATSLRMALSIQTTLKLNSGHSIPQLGFGVFESKDALKSTTAALKAGYRYAYAPTSPR